MQSEDLKSFDNRGARVEMEEMEVNQKKCQRGEHGTASIDTDILNPFVHRLELDTTYDKLKVSKHLEFTF